MSAMLVTPVSGSCKEARRHSKTDATHSGFISFENHEYLAKERADLQHAGVTPDPNSSNSRGSFWDDQGNQWIRFCYDTGCTGTVIPKELVESDSGPMEPLTDGAREFSVANGESVPDYGRAFMWARSEHDKPGLIQSDVSTVNKPLGPGSSLANNYRSCMSKN